MKYSAGNMNISVHKKRTDAGLSLRELAELSGVSRSHIYDVENGAAMPTIGTMCQLAAALGVRPEDLYECPNLSGHPDK